MGAGFSTIAAVLAAAVLAASQGLPSIVPPLIPDENTTIDGIVREPGTGRPIPDAQVVVESGGRAAASARSDASGRFSLKGIPAGIYILVVGRDGYFAPFDGQPQGDGKVRRELTLNAGQHSTGITVEMIPGVVISGRVFDASRNPVAGAEVVAVEHRYAQGRRDLRTAAASAQTDDRGDYRLFGLRPGEYLVRARAHGRVSTADVFAEMYFPGASDGAAAAPLALKAGQEISSIDITVPLEPVRGFDIAGTIRIPAGGGVDPSSLTFYLLPALASDAPLLPVRPAAVRFSDSRPDSFQLRSVPAGRYNLYIFGKSVPASEEAPHDEAVYPFWFQAPLDVSDKNIENIEAVLVPGVELRGRVAFNGAGPADSQGSLRVVLQAREGFPSSPSGFPVDPKTGEFAIPAVAGARYDLRFSTALPDEAYLLDVLQSGKSVLQDGFFVGTETPAAVEVRVGSPGGTIEGTVQDALNAPIPFSRVALVPANRRIVPFYKTAVAGRDGRFVMSDIVPGSYKVFAWTNAPEGAWENREFVSRFERFGLSVEVASGGFLRVRPSVIP